MSINRAILLGNVGRDPEIRTTNGGDKVATFSLATSDSWKDKATGERKETTHWHNIVVWNQALVGIVEQYVTKGSKVGIEGAIQTRKWQHSDGSDRWSTEIVIGRFDGRLTLEGKPQGHRSEHGYGETRTRAPAGERSQSRAAAGGLDDDIPF